MAGAATENFQEEFELNQIRQNVKLDPRLRQSMMEDTKKSFYQKKKNSSLKTILSISNNMIGSSVLIFPLVFMKYGIINSTLVLILMGCISCETCLLEIRHVKMNEVDLPESVRRVLGVKWFYAFVISSFIFNAFCVIIYYILMTHLLYEILEYFLVLGWDDPLIASGADFTFSKFSIQYLEIILALMMMLLYSINSLRYILVICQYGIIPIFFYVFFLFYQGIQNIVVGNAIVQNLKFLSSDIANLAGIFSLAFFVHNNLITIVKTNQNPEKNGRDVVLGFVLTGCVYLFIGLFGAIAIAGLNIETTPQLVLDYFGNNFMTIIIEFFIFSQLLSVSPLNWYIGRTQMLEVIFGNNPTPKIYFHLINLLFVLTSLAVDLLRVDVTFLISFNGAVCGYLMLYIIPIKLHLNCLYEIHDKDLIFDGEILMKDYDSGFLGPESPISLSKMKIDDQTERALIDQLKMSKLIGLEVEYNGCKSAHLTMIRQTPKISRYICYGFIALFGAVIGIWELLYLVQGNS